jgi:hypothetical protein
MQQPSAQGIASLYRGNPQPLQQSLQQEQKARPGLPPDLQKMLALQIVNNEKDGFAAQKAMEQLQQMSGGMGKPPTVMQSLEQQAQQKLQAQAMQAQQQQQGLQALAQQAPAGPVPAGTPQPEEQPQPQGLDQSDRVAFAGAEGGIVAFSGKDRSDVPDESKDESKDEPLDAQAAADREAVLRMLQGARRGSEMAGRAIADVATMVPRGLAGAYDTAMVRPMRAAGINAAYVSPKLVPEGVDPSSMTPFTDVARLREAAAGQKAQAATAADNRALLNKADAAMRSAPPEAPVQSPIAKDLAQLAQQKAAPVAAPRPAAMASAAPVAPAAPAAPSAADLMMASRMKEDPAAREAAETAKYAAAVGAPDTTQHDRLIAELEKRKQQLEPKQGFEGLMEYLGQVSRADVRGRGSFASGAAGAARLEDLNKERQLQQFELSKQAIDVSQKKLDTVRAFAEKKYSVGKTAFDQVYKDQFEAAKEVSKTEQAAKQLAQQNTLKILEMENQLKNTALHGGFQLQAAKMGQEAREAARTTLTPAQRAKIADDAASNVQAELGKDPRKMMEASKNPALRATLVQRETERLMAAAEGRTMPAAPGAEGLGGTTRMRFDAQGNQIK